jgi:hypothetical protein
VLPFATTLFQLGAFRRWLSANIIEKYYEFLLYVGGERAAQPLYRCGERLAIELLWCFMPGAVYPVFPLKFFGSIC